MRHCADARTSLHLDRFVLYRQGEQHELSEAISSMYRWYGETTVCYAFLADVSLDNNARDSDAHGNDAHDTASQFVEVVGSPGAGRFRSSLLRATSSSYLENGMSSGRNQALLRF